MQLRYFTDNLVVRESRGFSALATLECYHVL